MPSSRYRRSSTNIVAPSESGAWRPRPLPGVLTQEAFPGHPELRKNEKRASRRANQNGAMCGMVCGFAMNLYLWRRTHVPWTWWVLIGATVTFAVGWAMSFLWQFPKKTS